MLFSSDAFAILLGALLVDALVGDPDWLWRRWPHPVVWFGQLVAWVDGAFNREGWSAEARRAAGAVALAGLVALVGTIGFLIQEMLLALPAGGVLVALVASVFLAQRSLYEHVRFVRDSFGTGGLQGARAAVARIVGRDPERLDEAGVCRAAIESAAENFSDGVVAPAFWFAVLGLPGLLAYKLINTADSMIGHLSVRYRDFGWASARLDDLVNLLPARLSGCLLAGAAWVAGGSPGRAIDTMLRDAKLHRSPNAGWPEAAMAGALGIALAGPRVYSSGLVADPFLNAEGRRPAVPGDIHRCLRVLAVGSGLHALIYILLAMIS